MTIVRLAGLATGLSIWATACVVYHDRPLEPGRAAAAFDSRTLDGADIRAFLTAVVGHEPAEWPLATWDLESLTLAAFFFHPDLEVARAQWRVAQAGVKTAGGRPNPSIGLSPGLSFNPAAGASPWLPLLSLDVPIETAGKRGHRIAQAEGLSEASRLGIASTAWRVRKNLRAALIAWSQAGHREVALRQLAEVQEALSERLRQRFESGLISSYELSQARIAAEKLRLDADEARRQQTEERVRLAEAVGAPVRALARLAIVGPWDIPAASDLTSVDFRQQALTSRADVLAGLAEYTAAQAALRLEIAKQYPDIHLGTGYQFDQGQHKWSLGLTLDIPFFNSNEGPLAEATARRLEVAARFEATQARALAEIDLAITALANAQARLQELDRLIAAQAKQRAAVLDQLAAGAADRLELLTVEAEVAQGELMRVDGQARALQALGALEDALQRPREAWAAAERGPTTPPVDEGRP
jgi:outer membrane protein, heavy metal efflux system